MRFFQSRQDKVTAGILVAGFAAAFFIYVSSTPLADRAGERPEDSKRYLRQMEVYGGHANVLASELREWFEARWHGRTLAFTVAFLSILLAGVAFIVLTPLPPRVGASGAAQADAADPDP
jgi:hypothetical protein